MKMKICKTCGNSFPANKHYFAQRSAPYKDGNKCMCKHTCKFCIQVKNGIKSDETRRAKYLELSKVTKPYLTNKEWIYTLRYFEFKCVYCEANLKDTILTADHLIPLIEGGQYTMGNIVPACRSCNSSKGTRDWVNWSKHQKRGSDARIREFIIVTKLIKALEGEDEGMYEV